MENTKCKRCRDEALARVGLEDVSDKITNYFKTTSKEEMQKQQEMLARDRKYVGEMLRKHNVTEDAFEKGDYSSIPKKERKSVMETIKRIKENPYFLIHQFATGL